MLCNIFQKFSNVRTICFPFALKSRRAQTLLDAEIGVSVDSNIVKRLVPFIVGFAKLEKVVLMPWDTYVRIHTYGTYGDQTTDSVPSPDR